MRSEFKDVDSFAKFLAKVLKSDRDAMICVSGFTGEGKSTLAVLLSRALAKYLKTNFSFENNMTYLREEFVEMIDGDKKLPEYSVLLVDEIVSLFNRRNWMKRGQKGALELLDKCRDRHLVMIGNAPTFWNLDNMLVHNKTRFWIHVHKRGFAWVFSPIKNPFTKDKWQRDRNEKVYAKGGISALTRIDNSNFLCSLQFEDLDKKLKKEYLKIRNEKRKNTEQQDDEVESYKKIKKQRNKCWLKMVNDLDMKQADIVRLCRVDSGLVSKVINGKEAKEI